MTLKIGEFMKSIFILFFVLYSSLGLAELVNLEVAPNRPVVGETFQLVFKISTSDSEEPYISFDRGTADVIGKSNRGVSINTTIINGKFSTTRTLTYVYELVATRPGPLRVSNIKVEIGGKEYKVRSKIVNILREAVRAKDFFLQAEPSKTEVFIGQGIDIRYYLYTKVPIVSQEVKAFPKLNRFIKRFHMINREVTTTVEYMGEIYKKSLKYSARVYPEKIGRAYIDPLKLRVQYSDSNRNSPFGAFGLRMRQYKTRSIQSKKIEIKINPIPTQGVPNDFTGLVGDHDFEFSLNKKKYLVNEVVEGRLEISGPGALENYAAPKVFMHPNLEDFDTKAEFSELSKVLGKKVFDYTFLARDNFLIPSREMSFSIFDPNTKSFVTKKIQLPSLEVQGGIIKPSTGGSSSESAEKETSSVASNKTLGLVAPTFISDSLFKKMNILRIANYLLGIIALFLVFIPFGGRIKSSFAKTNIEIEIQTLKKKGFSYHGLYTLLSRLPSNKDDFDIYQRLEESSLSKDAQQYFKSTLENCEVEDFSGINSSIKKNFQSRFFNELEKAVREKKIGKDY
jgi:hypothetical protein